MTLLSWIKKFIQKSKEWRKHVERESQRANDEHQKHAETHLQYDDEFEHVLKTELNVSDAHLPPIKPIEADKYNPIEQSFDLAALNELVKLIQNNIIKPIDEQRTKIHASQELINQNNELMRDLARLRTAITRLPPSLGQQVTWIFSASQSDPKTKLFNILYHLYVHPNQQPTEADICALTGPQIIPVSTIIQFLQENVPTTNYRGHKLLAHLRLLAPKLAPNDERHLNIVMEIIHQRIDRTNQIIRNHATPTAEQMELDADQITWPFRNVINQHLDSYATKILNQKDDYPNIETTWSFVPDRTLFDAGHAAEDALWFDTTDAQHFCAIVADGASQSAMGGISAQVISQNLYRLYRHVGSRMPTKDEIIHLFSCARWDCHELLDTAMQSVPSYMRLSIEQKRRTSGSQSVVSMVIRHDDKLLVAWVGNVRVIIPGIIEADSPLFDSDGARFTSNHGLLGELNYEEFDISTLNPIRIIMHSDAVEHMKHRLVERTLTDAELEECAKSDDTTVIDIRIA
jgi:hypothetical protein